MFFSWQIGTPVENQVDVQRCVVAQRSGCGTVCPPPKERAGLKRHEEAAALGVVSARVEYLTSFARARAS